MYYEYRRRTRESEIYDAVYYKLVKGPNLKAQIDILIPRQDLIETVKNLITPNADARFYPLICGEHGTGKTSLIKLIIGGMNEPKGVVYVDIPMKKNTPVHLAQEIKKAIDFNLYPKNTGSDKLPELEDILDVFSDAAVRYKQEYGKIPV